MNSGKPEYNAAEVRYLIPLACAAKYSMELKKNKMLEENERWVAIEVFGIKRKKLPVAGTGIHALVETLQNINPEFTETPTTLLRGTEIPTEFAEFVFWWFKSEMDIDYREI